MNVQAPAAPSTSLTPTDKQQLEDIGFLTCMTLTLLGNYAQTGHFGGPLAYTPYNVALHLVGPELGGLRYDYRRPKHPYADKFMLAGGHCIPTCYALWMIQGQALALQVGKRLRIMMSDNNAGIDDSLIGGVIKAKYTGYDLIEQWTSYGWQVLPVDDGNDYTQVVSALKWMEDADPKDRRPII